MYKKVFLLFSLVLGLNAFAQKASLDTLIKKTTVVEDAPKVSFGIKLSPAIAWMNVTHDDMQAEGATLKMGIGGVVDFRLTPVVSFVTGLNFRGVGGYVHDSASLASLISYSTYKLNYKEIDIPAAFKFQTPFVNKTSYFVQGGLSVGFIVNATEKYYPVAKNADPWYRKTGLLTNPTRVSYQLGAGAERRIYKTSSVFGLISYNKSISNVANRIAYTSGNTPRYANPPELMPGSMEFSVGVMF